MIILNSYLLNSLVGIESQEHWVENGEKFLMANCSTPIVLTIYPLFWKADNGKNNTVFVL